MTPPPGPRPRRQGIWPRAPLPFAAASEGSIHDRSDQVKLRRGLIYLAMTLVLPGSVQLQAGNRALGRVALRIWAGLWAVVLAVGLVAVTWRSGAIDLLTFPPTLRFAQVVLVGVGLGWGFLLVDAWRISRPPELARRHRLGFAILHFSLVAAIVGALISTGSIIAAQRDFVSSVFAGGGDSSSRDGRFNILLLGGDAGPNRVGLRPDSITVASIDAQTGRTVLFSLPRNLEDVPFPATSPLQNRFPNGFSCDDDGCMLNAVYSYASENPDLYPGVKDPGAQATKEAVEGATGLAINYYALIDLKGFQTLVDAVGGIRIDVNRRVPIGGGSTPITGYIEPGRNKHLNGYNALWFARSRAGSSDYERMARQKCVMNAMLNQLDPATVLTRFKAIAAAGKQIMATDIPASDINLLLDLALKARALPVSSVSFVPPLIYPGNPKYALIQKTVQQKIARAEAADQKDSTSTKPTRKNPKRPTASTPSHRASSSPSKETTHPEPDVSTRADAEDTALGKVCTVN